MRLGQRAPKQGLGAEPLRGFGGSSGVIKLSHQTSSNVRLKFGSKTKKRKLGSFSNPLHSKPYVITEVNGREEYKAEALTKTEVGSYNYSISFTATGRPTIISPLVP